MGSWDHGDTTIGYHLNGYQNDESIIKKHEEVSMDFPVFDSSDLLVLARPLAKRGPPTYLPDLLDNTPVVWHR